MKKLVLAAAIASMLSGAAFATTDLDAGTGSGGTYANEITIAASTNLAVGAAAAQDATVKFGASFASDSVAYVRFALPAGQTFTANPTYAVNDSSAGPATVSIAQGGAGSNVVIFAVAPTAGDNLVGANVGTFTAAGVTLSTKATVTLEYKLFETLTNAANNTLSLKTASANFLTFANALAIAQGTAVTRTADVASAGGAYRKFLSASTLESLNSFTVTHSAKALTSGAASTTAAILADTNSVVITGDFSARATGGVWLDNASTCDGAATAATSITNTTATFSGLASATIVTGTPLYVCYEVNGTAQIPAASYTGAVDLVGNTGFSPTDGTTGTAAVDRNGTVLKAAFAEASTVSGTASAVSLTNTSSSAAPFTVRCLNSGAATTGTPGSVPANSSGRFSIVAALGCPAGVRGLELTFAVPEGSVIGSVVRQNLTTGVAGFDSMVGNK